MSGQSTSVLARLRQPVGTPRGGRHTIGGIPQVSLLPTEVREAGAVASHRRKLVGVVVASAIVAGGGVFLAQTVDDTAQAGLQSATEQSTVLAGQIGKFNDVRSLQSRIALGNAGVKVGSSTMIDWQQQIDDIEGDMPAGYSVSAISANGATPTATYVQGDNLLEPTRAATVAMTISTSSIGDEFSTWLRQLRSIPAYADASADSVFNAAEGTYTINLTVHLTAKAISAGTWTEQP